ncbi:MAG TPA: hypothetical protein VGD67_07625, partial [Pseudonocardiaceae bacterium]
MRVRGCRRWAALALVLAVAGCGTGDDGRSGDGGNDGNGAARSGGSGDAGGSGTVARRPEVAFTRVGLPDATLPVVLTPEGDGLLVGTRRGGAPGLLRLGAAGAITEVPLAPATPYGREAEWRAIEVAGDRILAVGGERGGAHGNVRWSIWTGSGAGLTEWPQGFSVFGGYGAGELVGVARTADGPVVLGSWESRDTGSDVAVWTTADGMTWARQSSAGTPLESRRGALGFPTAATAAGDAALVVGWELAGGQRPVAWR